jgi:hypothetical protein
MPIACSIAKADAVRCGRVDPGLLKEKVHNLGSAELAGHPKRDVVIGCRVHPLVAQQAKDDLNVPVLHGGSECEAVFAARVTSAV